MAWNEAFERIRARLHNRAFSYQALFVTRAPQEKDSRTWLERLYKPAPVRLNAAADTVLRDLAQYCYANKPTLKVSPTTQQTDALAMAFAEGRRDVFNRITAMCNLTSDQIERIASQRSTEE